MDNSDPRSDPELNRIEQEFRSLIEQVRAGSEEAAWELISQYGRYIIRVVRRSLDERVRPKFDSEDFVQAVWLSFFRNRRQISNFDQPENLVGFLAKAARNKVMQEHRKRLETKAYDVERETALDSRLCEREPFALASQDPTPSEIAIGRERWERLVASQSPRDREVLRLLFLGHRQTEVAAMLQIDPRTVRKVLTRIDNIRAWQESELANLESS